jgi:hypothetical protein
MWHRMDKSSEMSPFHKFAMDTKIARLITEEYYNTIIMENIKEFIA